jgi:hypothetical protein
MTDLEQRLRDKANDFYKWDGETMKQWDRIRHAIETKKGSDVPRMMFEEIIEEAADLFIEAAEALNKQGVS